MKQMNLENYQSAEREDNQSDDDSDGFLRHGHVANIGYFEVSRTPINIS